MICPKCGSLNSDGALACPVCVRRSYEFEQEKYQRVYLDRVQAGRALLIGVTRPRDPHMHARMAGIPSTYCGENTKQRGWDVGKLLWEGIDAAHFCPACRITINRLRAKPVEAA